jgi:hypothetical protein
MTTSLHDLRGMANAAQKRYRRAISNKNYDAFEDAAIKWHKETIRSYGKDGKYWRYVDANFSCPCCDLEEDRACIGCEALNHWFNRDRQAWFPTEE